jgi:hypothetical protein
MSPEIRPLFKRSMVSQGRMLANMIKSVVVNITRMDDALCRVCVLFILP